MDYVFEPSRPSRRLIWSGRALLAICAASGLLLVVQPSDPATPPSTTVPTTTLPLTLRLRASGLGPVTIGMTWAQALAVGMGVAQDFPGCQIGRYADALVYVPEGTVTVIVVQDSGVRALRGVGVGSSRFEVGALYAGAMSDGDRLVVTEGGNELVFGFRDDVVVYIWARIKGAEGVGC